MISLITLSIITYLIFSIQKRIWKISSNLILPMCTIIFYYWSLAGAWIFIVDQSFGEFGRKLYMSYYVYLEKIYPVKLDHTYTQMIVYYGVFILSFQLISLYLLRKYNVSKIQDQQIIPIKINPVVVSIGVVIFILISFYIVKTPIFKSIFLEESIYINVRKGLVSNYSFHQLSNLAACFLAYFYLAIWLRKDKGFYFQTVSSTLGNLIFILAFIATNLWLVFLGNRHEILILGITSFLYITYPKINKHQYQSIGILMGVLFICFVVTDPMRSLAPKLLKPLQSKDFILNDGTLKSISDYMQLESKESFKNDKDELMYLRVKQIRKNILEGRALIDSVSFPQMNEQHKESRSHVYYKVSKWTKVKLALGNIVFSNEMFTGQFSLYGSLKNNIPQTWGHSFKSMVSSFLPRVFKKERPESSYAYYARKMNLNHDQGFTINHATDWYLNFGIIGIILGGFFWGAIISFLYIAAKNINFIKYRSFYFLALISVAAYFSMIIRGGIDVLKVIVFEAFLIPVLLLVCCDYGTRLFQFLTTIKNK